MRGFTLIEVLVYMGIYVLFAGALASCVISLQDSSTHAESKAAEVETRLLESAQNNRQLHGTR